MELDEQEKELEQSATAIIKDCEYRIEGCLSQIKYLQDRLKFYRESHADNAEILRLIAIKKSL